MADRASRPWRRMTAYATIPITGARKSIRSCTASRLTGSCTAARRGRQQDCVGPGRKHLKIGPRYDRRSCHENDRVRLATVFEELRHTARGHRLPAETQSLLMKSGRHLGRPSVESSRRSPSHSRDRYSESPADRGLCQRSCRSASSVGSRLFASRLTAVRQASTTASHRVWDRSHRQLKLALPDGPGTPRWTTSVGPARVSCRGC